MLVACVGGGSNAMGLFYPFIDKKSVRLIGVEAGGLGLSTGKHAAPLNDGKEGVLHGMRTYLMQDDKGQVIETHSVSAGLDYPGVGPEHAWLKDIGRAEYEAADDEEALDAFKELTRVEGIMPALETAHGIAYVKKVAPTMSKDNSIVVNVSGRGDKDINTVASIEGIELEFQDQRSLSNIKAQKRKALITYIVSGDPDIQQPLLSCTAWLKRVQNSSLEYLFLTRWPKEYQYKEGMKEL